MKRITSWTCATLLLASLVALHAAGSAELGVTFFVAPKGSDTNSGTADKPFATLEQARNAARQVQHGKIGEPVTVWLAGGVYRCTDSFRLEQQDHDITFAARTGAQVVLTGGRPLPRAWFERTTDAAVLKRIIDELAHDKVWQVNLRAHGITDYGENQRRGFSKNDFYGTPPLQLYIGDQRMVLARWPNPEEKFPQYLHPLLKNHPGVVARAGKGAVVDTGPTMRDADFRKRGGAFKYGFDRPEKWLCAEEIWLDGIFNEVWEWSYNRVAKIDPTAKTIRLCYGECNGINEKYSGDFFFAENLFEELDRPGEYWLDRQHGMLYLIPPPEFFNDNVDITVTMLKKPMIEISNATHITFRNLELNFGRDVAVCARKAEAIRFEHCVIRDFTDGGLDLSGKNHAVMACQLLRNGGTSISLSGGNALTLEAGGNVAEDCEILDSGWYHRVYHPAIALRGVGQRASHNRIRSHPHVAIHITGNDQLVEGNDLGNVCEEFMDMGAVYIYTGNYPTERGQIVRGNFIHDLGRYPMQNAIYPDNGTMSVLIEGNIFARIGSAITRARTAGASDTCRAIQNNSGAYIITRNNLFIDCPVPYLLSAFSGGKNHATQKERWQKFFAMHPLNSLPHYAKYPELQNFWNEERQFPISNVYERNAVWNPNRPLIQSWGSSKKRPPATFVDGAVEEYPGLTKRDNWVATADPGFVNAATGDYTLKPGAEIFRRIPDFKPISFRAIGPRIQPGLLDKPNLPIPAAGKRAS